MLDYPEDTNLSLFTMTHEQWLRLYDARKSGTHPAVWQQLSEELGFVLGTVKPQTGHPKYEFLAQRMSTAKPQQEPR